MSGLCKKERKRLKARDKRRQAIKALEATIPKVRRNPYLVMAVRAPKPTSGHDWAFNARVDRAQRKENDK